MAKGNWNPSVIKPKTRCRLCGYVIKKKDLVKLEGIYPAHLSCALKTDREFTERPTKGIEIEITNSISITR